MLIGPTGEGRMLAVALNPEPGEQAVYYLATPFYRLPLAQGVLGSTLETGLLRQKLFEGHASSPVRLSAQCQTRDWS